MERGLTPGWQSPRWMALCLALLLIAGCASTPQRNGDGGSEQYIAARAALERGNAAEAVEAYRDLLDSDNVDPRYEEAARLELGYAYFELGRYRDAIEAADTFLSVHGDGPRRGHGLYLRGRAAHARSRGLRELDPGSEAYEQAARRAFEHMAAVVRHDPDGSFREPALDVMADIREGLAHHQLLVAQQLYDEGKHGEAVSRVDYIRRHYEEAEILPDALALQADSYYALGDAERARETRALLAQRFPDYDDE